MIKIAFIQLIETIRTNFPNLSISTFDPLFIEAQAKMELLKSMGAPFQSSFHRVASSKDLAEELFGETFNPLFIELM